MGFRPDEARVDDAQLVQSSQLLQAQRQEFSGLRRGNDPRVGRREPSVAVAAHVKGRFTLDAACRICLELDAVIAEGACRLSAIDGSTAVCAEDGGGRLCCGYETKRGVDLHGSDVKVALVGEGGYRWWLCGLATLNLGKQKSP